MDSISLSIAYDKIVPLIRRIKQQRADNKGLDKLIYAHGIQPHEVDMYKIAFENCDDEEKAKEEMKKYIEKILGSSSLINNDENIPTNGNTFTLLENVKIILQFLTKLAQGRKYFITYWS